MSSHRPKFDLLEDRPKSAAAQHAPKSLTQPTTSAAAPQIRRQMLKALTRKAESSTLREVDCMRSDPSEVSAGVRTLHVYPPNSVGPLFYVLLHCC